MRRFRGSGGRGPKKPQEAPGVCCAGPSGVGEGAEAAGAAGEGEVEPEGLSCLGSPGEAGGACGLPPPSEGVETAPPELGPQLPQVLEANVFELGPEEEEAAVEAEAAEEERTRGRMYSLA